MCVSGETWDTREAAVGRERSADFGIMQMESQILAFLLSAHGNDLG